MMQQPNTTNKTNPTPSEQPEQHRPVKTVRSGDIGASIWLDKSESGKEYYSISLSRAWKPKDSESFSYSHKYFAGNRANLHEAIDKACDVVERLENQANQSSDQQEN